MHVSQHRYCFAALCLGLFAGQARAQEAAQAIATAPVRAVEPKEVDIRPMLEQWKLPPRSQGSRPTCSVFAFAGALEFAVARAQQRGEPLSVEYLNWAANQTGRGVRDGGFFSEMWNGFAAQGICTEKAMPYQNQFHTTNAPSVEARAEAKARLGLGLQLHWIKRWNVKTGLSSNEFAAIKQTLDQGWPVCGGLRWPKQEVWENEVLKMAGPEGVFDGHSVLLVGYRDEAQPPGGGVFIIRNPGRGGRDGFMPYAYAQAYMNDAAWIESKPQPETAPEAVR